MASAVHRKETGSKPRRNLHSRELLKPPKGPGVCFLKKELDKSPAFGTGPPQTYRVESSSILSRVKAFLPQLEEADKQLQERLQVESKEQLDIESLQEGESCIQMDLAVVPVPQDSSSSDESSDESDNDISTNEQDKRTLASQTFHLKLRQTEPNAKSSNCCITEIL